MGEILLSRTIDRVFLEELQAKELGEYIYWLLENEAGLNAALGIEDGVDVMIVARRR